MDEACFEQQEGFHVLREKKNPSANKSYRSGVADMLQNDAVGG